MASNCSEYSSRFENQIHSDELAKEYGFKGGLSRVTVSAYLLHPVIESFMRYGWQMVTPIAKFLHLSMMEKHLQFRPKSEGRLRRHF